MAATTRASGAGFRHLRVYALNSDGFGVIPTPGAAGYNGLQVAVAKAMTLTVPDAQIISHTGDDRVSQIDLLPPTEGVAGEIRTGRTDLTLDALLSNTKVRTLASMQVGAMATDQQGMEPDFCVLAYRQAVDADLTSANKGQRNWVWVLLSKALIFSKWGAMEEGGADENTYTLQPRVFNKYPWGTAFTLTDDGYLETQLLRGVSRYRPHLAYWEGTGAVLEFNFSTGFQGPADIADRCKVYHWVALTGVVTDVTATVTIAADGITFLAAPADGDIVVAFYEIADVQ
jgi:hypothetical protein